MSKERPIIMTSESVQGILDGRKTQTRRIIKMPEGIAAKYEYEGDDGGNELLPKQSGHYWMNGYAMWRPKKCPYGVVGDRLWVRETFSACKKHVCGFDANGPGEGWVWDKKKPIIYKATCDFPKDPETYGGYGWKPSIHMPKWVARIWLEITNIRVERVQDISGEDYLAEGIWKGDNRTSTVTLRQRFRLLWDSLNAKRGYSWEKNLFVWVIEFRRSK